MKEIVRYLSRCSKTERISRLIEILDQHEIPIQIQKTKDVVNILAGDFDNKEKKPLLCAHHDVVPESSGANDNLASIAIVIKLLETSRCRAVFLDGEESGHTGAKLFCQEAPKDRIECMIVLDVCGYGNCMTYWICRGRFCRTFRKLTATRIRKKYHLLSSCFLPESDDRVLGLLQRPLMRMSVLPEKDAYALKALEAFPDLTTDVAEVIGSLEVSQTIHGSLLDDPDILMPESMENVVCHLQEAFIR